MKLATYKDGSRDGQLVVVSRDLSTAHYATGIANTLQQVLDDWNFLAPQLQDLSHTLNLGKARHAFPFEPQRCLAPLPRAYQWVHGLAGGDAVAPAPPADAPPRMQQGASDDLLGPCDELRVASQDLGIDFEPGLAVVTADVPLGASAEEALEGVRLVMLANALCLRQAVPGQSEPDPGLPPARPATAFGPVAVSLDELGQAWQGGRLHLALHSSWNGRRFGLCEAGAGMDFHFGQLIAHLCRTRRVRAGSIIGSGPLGNRSADADGAPSAAGGHGSIAQRRAAQSREGGEPATGFLKFGDSLRIDVRDAHGQSVFGAIDQKVAPAG